MRREIVCNAGMEKTKMENSKECPIATMTDVMWVNGFLSSALPYKCGAWQEMRREIVVPNDGCGAMCPRLMRIEARDVSCPRWE